MSSDSLDGHSDCNLRSQLSKLEKAVAVSGIFSGLGAVLPLLLCEVLSVIIRQSLPISLLLFIKSFGKISPDFCQL